MPEAVIVATTRSPVGRAFKGPLASIRGDDLTVHIGMGTTVEKSQSTAFSVQKPELTVSPHKG